MNAHAPTTFADTLFDLDMIALGKRADRIAKRLFPVPQETPHGFYQTGLFIDVCRMRSAQGRLRKYVLRKLVAKAANAKPYLPPEHIAALMGGASK